MIQAITFDLWNTIFNNRFYTEMRLHWFSQFLNEKGISQSEIDIENTFKFGLHLHKRNFENNYHIYTKDRILEVLKILKIDLSKKDKAIIKKEFEEVMLIAPPSLKKGTRQTLETLSSDYKIGLISNTGITPGRIIIKVLQEYNILQYFQVKIFSDEIGYYKPHPILFNKALKKLECDPRNAIHIGDILETDVKGAKECNMHTIWFNDSFSKKSKKIKPDYEIREISEVISIIYNII